MNKLSSAVATHSHESGHIFDFNNARMLYPCNEVSKRHIIESACISTNREKCVNLNYGFSPLGEYVSNCLISCIFPKT